jgi:hypothetical protein
LFLLHIFNITRTARQEPGRFCARFPDRVLVSQEPSAGSLCSHWEPIVDSPHASERDDVISTHDVAMTLRQRCSDVTSCIVFRIHPDVNDVTPWVMPGSTCFTSVVQKCETRFFYLGEREYFSLSGSRNGMADGLYCSGATESQTWVACVKGVNQGHSL